MAKKTYDLVGWQNESTGNTPVSPDNLKHMDEGIKYLYDEGATSKDIFICEDGQTVEDAPEEAKVVFEKNVTNSKASFENGTILFSSGDGEAGNFTLSESVTKYKYLEIEFNTNNVYKIVKCSKINPNVELSISRAEYLDNSYYGIRIEVGKLYISGTSVTRSLGYKVTIKATDSSVIFSDSNEIKVNKVVGYN